MVKELDGMIAVMDLWPIHSAAGRAHISTVTEEPQAALYELQRRGYPINDRPVLYCDEHNRWDQILVNKGEFDNFYMLHAPSWEIAVQRMIDDGRLSHRDRLKPPAVGTGFRI